jgi:hypothetical protein
VTIGAVLDEAWSLFAHFFLRFFVLALVVFVTINRLYALLARALVADNDGVALLPRWGAIAVPITYFRLREAHAGTGAPVEA